MAHPLPYGIKAFLMTEFVYPGWHRRRRDNGRLERIGGWRLVLHRLLWGFDRITYVEPDSPDCWQILPLDFDVNRFLRIMVGQEALC